MRLRKCAVFAAAVCAVAGFGAAGAGAQKKAPAAGGKAAVLAVVKRFEDAYKRKDGKTMLLTLMAPTGDKVKIQQRYEWLRGHGPGDAPNTAPTLFVSSRGSFVPVKYAVASVAPAGGGKWTVIVKEDGTYRDEDGKYRVSRTRHFDVVQVKGKWYVGDYYLKQNRENYGFPVDDISDKMEPLGN